MNALNTRNNLYDTTNICLSNTEKTMPQPPKVYEKRILEAEWRVQAIFFKHGRGRVAKKPVNLMAVSKEIDLQHASSTLQE
jgi:hypothetical protein